MADMSLAEAHPRSMPSRRAQVCLRCTLSAADTLEAELATGSLPDQKLTRQASLEAIGLPSGCRHLSFSSACEKMVLGMKLRSHLRKKTF